MSSNIAPDYEKILEDYINGRTPLPNVERLEPREFLNDLAAFGGSLTPVHGNAKLLGDLSSYAPWTMFFLSREQFGGLNGKGYFVRYASRENEIPIVGTFAVCKHEKVEGAGANPRRGYHPGHCRLCGLDMLVDSSD